MIAKINHSNNLYGALAYNQQKVDEGHAKILVCNKIMEPADGRFNTYSCMEDFERFMPSHHRISKPVVHISLNPHPDDKLTDAQLTDIAQEYLERLGYGDQPYMIFKHEDIDRHHLHLVTTRVRMDGTPVPDNMERRRSSKIVEQLEQQHGLIPAKGQKRDEPWQLSPVDTSRGDVKKQLADTIKSLAETYRFQNLGEYRALLSLYNIGVEEIKGENAGHLYRGLVYSATDGNGNRVGNPFKSSLFGKAVGIEALEAGMTRNTEQLAPDTLDRTRQRVATCLASTQSEGAFREALQKNGIDLVLRRNNEGRLFGVTYIDHNEHSVMNGSRLGKGFSANAISAKFADTTVGAVPHTPILASAIHTPATNMRPPASAQPATDHHLEREPDHGKHTPHPAERHSDGHNSYIGGGIFSVIPATHTPEEKQPPTPRRKKRRKYGRQG